MCGTHPSTLERKRSRAHQIREPQNTETEVGRAGAGRYIGPTQICVSKAIFKNSCHIHLFTPYKPLTWQIPWGLALISCKATGDVNCFSPPKGSRLVAGGRGWRRSGSPNDVLASGDTTPCRMTGVTFHGVVSPDGGPGFRGLSPNF